MQSSTLKHVLLARAPADGGTTGHRSCARADVLVPFTAVQAAVRKQRRARLCLETPPPPFEEGLAAAVQLQCNRSLTKRALHGALAHNGTPLPHPCSCSSSSLSIQVCGILRRGSLDNRSMESRDREKVAGGHGRMGYRSSLDSPHISRQGPGLKPKHIGGSDGANGINAHLATANHSSDWLTDGVRLQRQAA